MMHKTLNNLLSLSLLCSLSATGIWGCGPVAVPGQTPASPEASANPDSPSTPDVTRIDVQVVIVDSSDQPVSEVDVKLGSLSQAERIERTGSDGVAEFKQIPQNAEYNIEVSKVGFEKTSRTADLGKLVTQNQSNVSLKIIVSPITTGITGVVVDAQGKPLSGASVFDGTTTTDTDSQGGFSFSYSQAQNVTLRVKKTGFGSSTREVQVQVGEPLNLGQIALQTQSSQRVIGIDLTHDSFGLSGSNALQNYKQVQSTLESEGYRVVQVTSDLLNTLPSLDGLLILSPQAAFSVEEKAAIQAFVLNGNKLVFTAEWAGFGGFSHANANQMLAPFNLVLGTDTLRSTDKSGFLSTTNFEAHPLVAGIQQLKFFQSSSVRLSQLGQAGALPVRTEDNTFRIVNTIGAFGLIGVAPFGSGNVVVLGDSSLWSDEDSDGNQVSNLDEADNRKLLSQIFSW
jgi:hypothetical protein